MCVKVLGPLCYIGLLRARIGLFMPGCIAMGAAVDVITSGIVMPVVVSE